MPPAGCKLPLRAAGGGLGLRRVVAPAAVISAMLVGGCAVRSHSVITPDELDAAVPRLPIDVRRGLLADPDRVRDLMTHLGSRMALIQVHAREQWDRLSAACGGLGVCPDLSRGDVFAVASLIGTPTDGDEWPVALEEVRAVRGAALLTASFAGGSYLPDGATYVCIAHVPDVRSVLIVEVNGVRFYPE